MTNFSHVAYIHTYIHTFIHIYIHTCIYTYININMLTQIYTFIHTYLIECRTKEEFVGKNHQLATIDPKIESNSRRIK